MITRLRTGVLVLACWATASALPALGLAQAPVVLPFDGLVPSGSETHFFVPFEVPPGIVAFEDGVAATPSQPSSRPIGHRVATFPVL